MLNGIYDMEDGIVVAYEELSKEELLQLKSDLEAQFEDVKAQNLHLDMSRGKPSTEQLNLSMDMMDVLRSDSALYVKKVLTAVTTVFWMVSQKRNSCLQI